MFLTSLAVLGVLAIAAFVACVIAYTRFSGYLDHVEPCIASISSLFFDGRQLYPADPGTPPHGMQYGPLSYFLPAVAIDVFGDAVFAPKLVSAIAAAGGVLVLTFAFLREAPWRLALIHAGAVVLALLALRHSAYWTRPEAQILLAVSLAIAACTLASCRTAPVVAGALLGIVIGLKINTAVVFIPLLGLLWHRDGKRALWLCAGIAAAVALAPFLNPRISLPEFLKSLTVAVAHGLERARFIEIFGASLLLVAPLLLVALVLRLTARGQFTNELRQYRAFWACVPIAIFIVVLIGSKRGSGSSHLVPLWPVVGYAMLRLSRLFTANTIQHFSSPLSRVTAAATIALTGVVLCAAAAQGQRNVWGNYRTYHIYYTEVRKDLERLLDDNPDRAFAIGFADGRFYECTWIRCELIRRGHPYLLEPVALMDLQAAGITVDPAQVIESPLVDAWLFPAEGGQPFSMSNIYPTGEILPKAFQKRFVEAWQPAGRTRTFEIWIRRGRSSANP